MLQQGQEAKPSPSDAARCQRKNTSKNLLRELRVNHGNLASKVRAAAAQGRSKDVRKAIALVHRKAASDASQATREARVALATHENHRKITERVFQASCHTDAILLA